MKKWLLWIVIIVLATVIGLFTLIPLALGFIVKHKYTEILQNWSQSDNVHLTLEKYHRGWFHSEAVVQVTLTSSTLLQLNKLLTNSDQPAVQFTLNQRIDHGPLLSVKSETGKSSHLLGRAVISSNVETLAGSIDTMTFIQLDGSLLSVVNAPTLHFNNPASNVSGTMSGLTMVLLMSADLSSAFGNINVAEGNIKTPDFLQSIRGLRQQFSLLKSPSGLLLGSRLMNLDEVAWETIDHKSQILMHGFTFQSQSQEQNARVNYKLDMVLDKFIVDAHSYGPQQLKLAINDLDVPTLLTIRKELMQIGGGDDSLSSAQLLGYNELFMILLTRGLEINLENLSLVTNLGNMSATLDIKLKTQPTTMVTSFGAFLNYLEVQSHIELPEAMLLQIMEKLNQTPLAHFAMLMGRATPTDVTAEQQTKQKIAEWEQKGWLLPTDGLYKTDISFKNNQVMINGQPITGAQTTQPLLPSQPLPVPVQQ